MLKKRTITKDKRGGWAPPPGTPWGPHPGGPFQKPHPPPFPGHHPQTNLTGCDTVVTPACLAALYQIPEPNHSAHPGNAIGIFESGDTYAQEDLDLFFANFTSYIPQGTHPKLDSIDGAVAPVPVADAGGESDLDFQLAYPIVYPIEVVLYQVDDPPYADGELSASGFGNTFLDALDGSYCTYTAFGETGNDPVLDPIYPDPSNYTGAYKGSLMCGTYQPTPVITISYGEQGKS
jgi:tripeptidyl-peptidase-1